jgi:nitrogen regulatory protein PII
MKVITAVIKPERLDDVIEAAIEAGARGLIATNVRGFGQQYGHMGSLRPGPHKALMLPKIRVDILATDQTAAQITEAIGKAANTGVIGVGKIWVCSVESALRVRTAERDREAV